MLCKCTRSSELANDADNRAQCNADDHLNDSFSGNNAHLIVPQESNFDLT